MAGPNPDLPDDRKAPGGPDDPTMPPSPSNGVDVDEYLSVGADDNQIPEELDQDSWVAIGEATERERDADDGGFYGNLAELLSDPDMDTVSTDLLRKIDEDKQARELRDKQYEEGIKRTGLGNDAPGGAMFEGASRVVHPMLTEACIDYESRVIKELMPPAGPVKAKIIGVPTKEKAQKAERKVAHMNWQITTQIKEAFSVLETTLTQVPLGGVQYIKQFWDHSAQRPRWQFVPVDHIYLPFSAADFQSSHRKTYVEKITQIEYDRRVKAGQYRDLELAAPGMVPETSKAGKANQKVEGLDDQGINVDGEREIYEVMTLLEVTDALGEQLDQEEVGRIYPYLITIDVTSKKVLSWYRDWEKDDETLDPIEHIFEFPFIPWRGAYSIGFPQIIGGLSAAATGALRALLDSAHINNAQGGFILKGSGVSGQTRKFQVGEMMEIDGGIESDDIRKKVMLASTQQPSEVLMNLLGALVDSAKGTVRTSLDETTIDTNANTPVGTQLSRVEEGLVVFSSIHGRIHQAFNRLLMGLHRLNKLYLPSTVRVDREGQEVLVKQSDYEGPCDVQPVSDPTIYSDQQRMAQITAIQQRMAVVPGLYKPRAVEERFLKLMKVVEPNELLVDEPAPHELNAVNENLAMATGKPTVVFPEQNHLAHLRVLVDFMQSPVLGMNPVLAPKFLPLAIDHAAQHIVFFYAAQTVHVVRDAAGRDPAELMSQDDKVKQAFDELLAEASAKVVPQMTQQLSPILQVLQKAQQMLQQLAPKPPLDPAIQAATQASMAETQRKGQADQMGHAVDTAKLQQDAALEAQRIAVDAERNQVQRDNAQFAGHIKLVTTQADNETALEISEDRALSGRGSGFTTGRSMEGS